MSERAVVPSSCERLLAALRRRTHRQLFAGAVLQVTGLLLLLLLGQFLLDYGLALPIPVRAVVLALLAFLMVRTVVVHLARPLGRVITDAALARVVEERHPEFAGTLLTAVQLARPGNPAAENVSPALLGEVAQAAAKHAAFVWPPGLLPARRLRRPAAICLGACCVWSLVALACGDAFSVWRERLLLGDVPWPRSVDLVMTQPEGPRALVASGDDLLVEVSVARGKVRQVDLVCDYGDITRVEVMTGWGDRVYRHTLPTLTRPCSFYARGGDGRTGTVEVVIVTRPRIERIAATVVYPAYTGVEPQASDDGNIKALERSTVTFVALARPAVRSAEFQLFGATGKDPLAVEALPVVAEEGGSRLEGSFTVTVSGDYRFTLESEEGFVNETPSRYRVIALPDRPPRIAIKAPGPTEECTRSADVGVEGTMSDDWGLAEARCVYRIKKPEERDPGPEAAFDLTVEKGAREASLAFPLRIGQLPVVEGSQILWRVEAVDAADNIASSAEQAIVIVRPEDLRDILFDRFNTVRDELRNLAEIQDRAALRLAALARETGAAATLGPEAASPLVQARSEELGIARRLALASEEFRRMRDRMERNVVGDLREQKWIGSLGDEVHDLGAERAAPLADQLGALAERVGAGNASPAKLAPLVDEGRAVERELRDLVDRMTQFGDLNQLIRQLGDILATQEKTKGYTKQLMDQKAQ